MTSLTPPGQPPHVFLYDDRDQEGEYAPPAVPGVADPSTLFTYNRESQPTGVFRPDGRSAALAYDGAGRLETLIIPRGIYDLAYDPTSGLLDTVTAPGGETLAFGCAGQLPTSVAWAGTVTGDVSWTFDADGRLASRSVNGGQTASFTYDAQDRLVSYDGLTYTQNAAGDRTAKTDPATGATTTYAYDVLGNLAQVDLPDGRTIGYVIDGANRRVGKTVDGQLERAWLYGDQLNPVAELDAPGNVAARFVYGSQPHVPDSMVKNGTTYRLLTDHLGSVRLVVDAATGAVAQRIDYDEFGRVPQDTNPGFQPFGLAGGLDDPDTGLVRLGARGLQTRERDERGLETRL